MKCPFKFEWKEITPAQAKTWLERKDANRSLREPTVNAFAQDMKGGRWSPNHQGIAFSDKGALIDGQHRLSACVLSKTPFWAMVFTGVPERVAGIQATVMETIDRGNARSIPDLLRLEHGYRGDANMIAAACLGIARICSLNPETAKKSTMPQTVAILGRFSSGLKYVSEERPTSIALRGAQICAAVAFAYQARPKDADAFYQAFKSGAGLQAGSPVLTFRNYVLQEGPGRSVATSAREFMDLVLHTMRLFVQGQSMPRIPGPGDRTGAQWWRDAQADNVEFVRALFPVVAATQKAKPDLTDGVKRHMGTARPRAVKPVPAATPAKASKVPAPPVPRSGYTPTRSREESPDLERVKVTLPMRMTVMEALDAWMEILKDPNATNARKDAFHRRYKILSACEEHGDNPERLSPVTFEDLVPRKAAVAA